MATKDVLAAVERKARQTRRNVNVKHGPDAYGGSNESKRRRELAKTSNTPTEDKRARMEAEGRDLYSPSPTGSSTYTPAATSSPKANAKYVPMDTADNQYAQALAAFNPGGTFVPRAAQEEIAARKAANHSRYMDALDTSTRAGVAAAGSGTVRPVMNTDETVAVRNEWAKKAAQYEADRQSAGREFRSARGSDEYRDRVGSFDRSAIPYGANNTGRIRYALDDSFRNEFDTFNQRQGLLDSTYENLKYLNEFEKNDLANLVAQGDYERANKYLDHLQPELNARMQGNVSAANKKLAEEQPVAGVLANIVGTREAGMALLPTIQGAINEEMGVYKPVDTNGSAFRAAHLLRDTEEGIGNAAYNAAGGGTKGEIARTLAQAGLSAAQNASMLPMGGTAPLVFMGSMAAGQSALDTLENGGTAQDALKVAVATGIIEAATEKIGIDNFFRVSRLGSKGIKEFLKGAKQYKLLANDIGSFSKALGSQMAAEGVEEMISEVAGNLADTAIRGDNGQYAQLVQNYMANGMSEEQAKARAFTDMYIDNVAKAGITGALAGGMLGAGGATIGTFQTSTRNRELIRNFEDVGNELQNLNITPEQLISAVQQSGSKDAQDFARELSQKLALGEEVTTAEMGRLHLLSNNYITSKDYEAVQKAAIAEEEAARNAGGNVRESEATAEAQLGEPLQRSQTQPVEAQNVTKTQEVVENVASKATNNTGSIEPTAGQANGRYAPKTMGVYAWDGELSAKLTPEEQAAIKRTNAQPYQSGRKGNRVLITWADEHGAVAEHWFSAGDIYFDGPTSWVQGGRGFSVGYDEIGKNVSQKELKALRRTPTTPSVVGVDKGKGVAYVEWRDENGNTVAKASFSTFDLGISSEWAEENFDWAEGNGSVGLPKEKPSSQAQSSTAQTATGNTAANAETNEANAERQSKTAAQSKTVAETSWENIQKIVQTKAKGGLSQKDEYTMNSAGRRAFDRIGRALGVEIHFVDRIVNEEGEANGLYQNGHIFISRNAENPYHVVLAHEITHHFEKTAPEVYEKFKGAALKMNPGLVEKYMAMWGYDEAVAEFEVAADFAGELLEKEGTVKRVIKEDISAARGFHRAMNAVFDKVRGDETKGLTEEEKKLDAQLDAARDMWRRCLRETRGEKAEGGESKAQFSLKSVPPVKPTGGQWKRGATFEEVKAAHPTLFELDADGSEKRNPTQIKGTVRTYNKIYDLLKAEGFDGTILDASSGLGYGTVSGRENYGFDVDDIEPFADKNYKPRYTDYSALNKKYDVVISNAVLNVLPQDLRDAMVVKIGDLLKPNGRAFVNVRGTDVTNASSKVAIDAPSMEYFISTSGSYQKGFTSKELVAYLQDALGDGFAVAPAKGFGAVSAIITREGKQTEPQMSRKLTPAQRKLDADYMAAVERGDMETAQRLVDEAAKAAGYTIKAYHGTRGDDFTVFDASRTGQNYGGYNAAGGAFDFTNTEEWARKWGAKAKGEGNVRVLPVFLRAEKTFYSYDGTVEPELANVLPESMTRKERDAAMENGAAFHKALEEHGIDFKNAIRRYGYDSYAMYPGADNISVYDPEHIKSADPVTYDDDGNVIPLSERFNEKRDDIRFSRKLTPEQKNRDEDYEAAVERGDMETAQRMVDEAAKKAGYDTPKLYHGTRAFGFTRFDKGKANDSISTFATDNPRTAETYSGETQRKRIKDRTQIDVDSLRGEELLREAKKQLKAYANFELMTNEARSALAEETRDEISYITTEGARFVNKNEDSFNDEQRKVLDRALNAISSLSIAKSEEAVEKAWEAFDDALWDLKWSDEDGSACQRFLDNFPLHSLHVAKNQLDDLLYQGDLFYRPTEHSPRYVFDAQLALELDAELHKGIYELYGKSGKQLVVNADGANWNQLAPPEELHLYGPQNTRAIAAAAKAHDYDSVLFKNVRDNGGETPYNGESNVYIFFNPSVLKSADPVTYDDNGEVIPLTERFNKKKDDIRFSRKSKQADTEALNNVNVAVDEKSESGYALQPQAQMLMQFSRKTFEASDYSPDSPNFKAAVKALARQLGVTQKQAKQFILDVNSVAATIAKDPARLDYVSAEGEGRSAFVSNAEYGGSIDFSTICPKRRMYMGTVEAIQKAMPDRVLSSDDILKIRSMMKDKGYQVACGFCFVEGSRAKLGYYTNKFRKELRDAGEEYIPTQAELMNIESLDRIRREHHDVYEKYLKFMNSLAQRKPKLFQPATEYNGEIIDKFGKDRDKAKVADKNWFGGLRIFSFSDFEAIHMIDMMQVVLDMARVGLAGQAYTKQPDFARVFGGTGIKINLSLVANGVDENGRLTFDGVEGMKIEDAMEIRDTYPDNVGTIVVTFTEAQLKAAMADDRIDFIIPFHRSQWTKKQYGRLGLPADTKDMTYWQNERYFKGKAPTRVNKNGKTVREKAKNFMPNTYWNFKKDGKTNAESYLKMCAEANKKPKFWNLLVDNKNGSYSLQPDGSTDGYWKLLGDFKMYNHKTGKGVPQKPVKPDFNMDEANRVMREYKGGHESFPVAQDVVDEFVSENGGKTNPQLSRKGQDAAMRRANRLARENARLKGQFKLTKGVKLRESDIRKVTRDLLKDYEIIDFDKDELERHIRAMAEAAQAADESNADKTWESIRNVARGLSRYVGRAAFARYADADEEYDADLVRETYEDIRRHLGRQRVLSPWFKDPWVENESPQRKEMRDYYRRKLFGVLTLTSDRSVDKGALGDIGKLYEELTETFGEAYFPSDVTNDEDQIMHIADVLDDLKDTLTRIGERTPMTVAEDVEQSSRDETRRAAYEDEVYGELYARLEEDILNRIAEVRREKPTFADKKKAEQYDAVERAIEQTRSKAEAAEIANRIEDAKKYRERIAKLEARLNKLKEENKGLKGEARQTQKDIRKADTYYRQAAQEALREAKAQKREALQELKDKYKAKTAEARERQNARELRRKIEKYTKDLYKTLAKPTNEKHINEDVRPAAALLISLINQESNFETDPATGKRVSRGGATRKAQLAGVGLDIDLPNILTKRTEAARKMRKAAEEIFSGEDNYLLVYDPELMENLAIMEDWADKPLAAMSSAELQVVWDAVRGVKHMITQSRKVFNEGRQWEVGTLASGLVRDVDLNNPRRTIKYGAAASVDKLLNIDQLTPQAYFHRFGEGGDRLFRMLRRSQDKYVRIIADIQARTAEVIKDIDIDKLNKDIATYKVKGGDVTLSRAQVLLLYASIKREQAAGHILGGGIKAKPLKGKGLFETKQLLPVEVTQEDLDNMFKEAKLTEAEKKAADGLVNIMSTVLAEYGNEASLRTYGYAKFREGWYVPIETDPTSNKTDNNDPLFKQFTAAASIAGRGFAKQTKEGAKNAIMVGSLFDVYAKHVNDMAMYAAYVETLENMRRVRNFKFKDGTKTQNYIEALLTQAGVAYWDKLINDINGGERLKNDDFSFDRFVGAYKAAAVSANIRVILQQPTAIIRAAAEINPAYLMAAMRKIPKRHEWDRVKKNSAIAQWKDWGYFDINTGRQMRDVVLGTDSLFEKFKQAGMRPMSGADSFAWTLLYHACEDEAKAKGLRPGGAAFDSFVASRFSDIIDKTQVVDGVLQRSQIMRSTNAVTKMATSFMAEPTKTYNMFLSAVWDFRHAKSKTERQTARKKLGFTVAALVVSFLTNAAAQSLIDALRDDDRDKEFLDKFWDAYLGRPEEDDKNKAVTVMGGNLWTAFNPVTYIPFFKDIVSLVQGFDTKRMDMESIGRVIDAAEQAWAASKGEGKQTAFARALALASEVSRVFGLPVANIKRDSVAVLNTIAQEKKDYGMMYNVDRAFYKLDKNVSRYVDIMLKAHDSGDTETEKRITDDLHAAGVDDKKIKSAADTIRKKQEGVDSVTEIKDRYRTYSEAASYNKLESYAKGTSAYRQANTTERSKYEKMLEDALANNDDAQGRHEKAQALGVSDNQYMEFLIAQDVANRQRNDGKDGGAGGVSKEDYIAALDMTSMTQSQKSAAFDKKYKKGNPYN